MEWMEPKVRLVPQLNRDLWVNRGLQERMVRTLTHLISLRWRHE